MKKTMTIEGMSCNHCKMRVEKALSAVEGVSTVEVNLEDKIAVLEITSDVADSILTEAVDDAGYDVVGIQ
ncbi:copper ion binding protein [Fusibacter bizertensis]|uniref:Copper ion binding protein n=1 Tax=Fusibacter bizertensis TaxID=1488331 RepID=A0ABT6NA63_9FIRM|nr:copper ion binding protein [Fusibacter bizertensis]MDH8677296.1 copper ion binding protein [Fusibacter bizertensis]